MPESNHEPLKKEPRDSRQWECEGHRQLTGHEGFLMLCRWKGTVFLGAGQSLHVFCRYYEVDRAKTLHLHDALVDTSERHQGVVLRKRMTWHREIVLVNCRGLFVHYDPPARPEELAEAVPVAE